MSKSVLGRNDRALVFITVREFLFSAFREMSAIPAMFSGSSSECSSDMPGQSYVGHLPSEVALLPEREPADDKDWSSTCELLARRTALAIMSPVSSSGPNIQHQTEVVIIKF